MGQLLSRVRKKQSTLDVLEDLDKEIGALEEYRRNTEQKRKRLVGTLVFYSVIIYIIAAVMSYFYWKADNLRSKLIRIIPLLVFPFLIWGLKLLVQWLFRRKLESNTDRLTEVLRKKRSILNEVKETETYKKAKEILEKFDPEYKRQQEKEKANALKVQQILSTPNPNLRHRPGRGGQTTGPIPRSGTPPKQRNFPSTSQSAMMTPINFPTGVQQWPRPPGPPLPRPVLPRETGVFDKMVDYLVGDGPSNRYALICFRCLSHNGMALKEEFEYLAFRCCYCYSVNPAKKIRPNAPRLPDPEPPLSLQAIPENVSNTESTDTQDKSNMEDNQNTETEQKINEEPKEEPNKTSHSDEEPLIEFPSESEDAETSEPAKEEGKKETSR